MSFIFLSLVIQALLIVHCIKTGRNQIWIWVLALLSYAGIIAYVAAELVPDLLRSRGFGMARILTAEDPAGQHNEISWARHTPEWLKFLFGR